MSTWASILEAHQKAVESQPKPKAKVVHKRCNRCQQFLSVDHFSVRSDVADGYRAQCKACHAKTTKERREKTNATNND